MITNTKAKTNTVVEAAKLQRVLINEMVKGDIFSEISHYVYTGNSTEFTHLESGKTVTLTEGYITDLLTTADQYHGDPVEVGKEDKFWTAKQIADEGRIGIKEGDLKIKGIRTLFEDIHSAQVFTVCFEKAPKELSKKAYTEAREKQIADALVMVDSAAKAKKGVANAAKIALETIQNNPIAPIEKGEDRILRGYKVQFISRDGKYDCMDMDINELRPVNLNTLKWLVFQGTKYIVK